jgi:hypothetical protein
VRHRCWSVGIGHGAYPVESRLIALGDAFVLAEMLVPRGDDELLENPTLLLSVGLPVVMEQERTLSRLAEARRGSGSNGPGRGALRNGGPACGEEEGRAILRLGPCFCLTAGVPGGNLGGFWIWR